MREFRGAWIASMSNIDWPSKPGLNASEQKAELRALLDLAAAAHPVGEIRIAALQREGAIAILVGAGDGLALHHGRVQGIVDVADDDRCALIEPRIE